MSASMLLRLPRDLLHSVLLFTRSDDVDALRASCTGRDPSVATVAGWSSFLSSLSCRLSDLEHLARESQLRQLNFQRMGYKQGLDQASTAVDDEERGLMRAPFREGFIAGAHAPSGWSDAAAKGIVAALACFAAKHASTLFAASPEHSHAARMAAEINNQTNLKLVSIPLMAAASVTSATPATAAGARATVALEQACSGGSDGAGCACAAAAAGAASSSASSAASCCSSKSGSSGVAGSCCSSSTAAASSSSAAAAAAASSVSAASLPADLPDLESASSVLTPAASSVVDKLDGSGAAALRAMQPLFALMGVSAAGLESIRALPPAAAPAALAAASAPTATAAASIPASYAATTPAPAAAARPVASASPSANRSSVESAQMATLDW